MYPPLLVSIPDPRAKGGGALDLALKVIEPRALSDRAPGVLGHRPDIGDRDPRVRLDQQLRDAGLEEFDLRHAGTFGFFVAGLKR